MSGLSLHWENLLREDMSQVCRKSLAVSDGSAYLLDYMGERYRIDISSRTVTGPDGKPSFEMAMVFLVYLLNAKEVFFSSVWVSANELENAAGFFTGIHSFPIDRLTERFRSNAAGFVSRGAELGGSGIQGYPNAVSITPLPRIRLGFVYWEGGEEFNDRVSMIFDSTCASHLPPDALWALVKDLIRRFER